MIKRQNNVLSRMKLELDELNFVVSGLLQFKLGHKSVNKFLMRSEIHSIGMYFTNFPIYPLPESTFEEFWVSCSKSFVLEKPVCFCNDLILMTCVYIVTVKIGSVKCLVCKTFLILCCI